MITKINLEQAERAVTVALMANQPVALWGGVGIGKSSIVAQITAKLPGWKMYDVRLSDKLSSDFGAPYPNMKTGKLDFLVTSLLPFDCDEKCIVFLDEYDRVQDVNVQNMTLQIVLDRSLNGHKLSPNARIVLAGNGVTDMGTTPLSKAAASRMCHLYIEGESEGALNSYLAWAQDNGVSPMLRAFARYRREVWNAGATNQGTEELAVPTKRTFDMADRLLRFSDAAKFETKDIVKPVIEGCIGSAAATELLGFRRQWLLAPTIEEVIKDPAAARLPGQLDVAYAFTLTLVDWAKAHTDARTLEAVAKYFTRWSEEQTSYAMKLIETRVPEACKTKSYIAWKNGR